MIIKACYYYSELVTHLIYYLFTLENKNNLQFLKWN